MFSSAHTAKRGKVHLFHILSHFLYTKQNKILALLTPLLQLPLQHKKQLNYEIKILQCNKTLFVTCRL